MDQRRNDGRGIVDAVIFGSLQVAADSSTPYTDATQVCYNRPRTHHVFQLGMSFPLVNVITDFFFRQDSQWYRLQQRKTFFL